MEDPAKVAPGVDTPNEPERDEKEAGPHTTNPPFCLQARENTLVKFVLYETKPVPLPARTLGSFFHRIN